MSPKILNYVGEIAPAQITVDIHPRRGAMGLGRRMRRARASGGESGGGSRWAWGGGCAERGQAEERAAADGCGLPRSQGERRQRLCKIYG